MKDHLYEMGPDLSGYHPIEPDRGTLAYALSLVAGNPDGWAVEFGVGGGTSIRMIAAVLPVIGFDSFKGLPTDWRPDFPAGFFGEYQMPTDIAGATIVPGWFTDTLPDYDWPERVDLIHFDADMYESTLLALECVGGSIGEGTLIVFDEFHGYGDDHSGEVPGEQRAWREYADQWGLIWDVLGHGREQWAIRVTGWAEE